MNDMAKNLILWVIIAIVLMSVFNNFSTQKTGAPVVSYSQFLEDVRQGTVAKVTIQTSIRMGRFFESASPYP